MNKKILLRSFFLFFLCLLCVLSACKPTLPKISVGTIWEAQPAENPDEDGHGVDITTATRVIQQHYTGFTKRIESVNEWIPAHLAHSDGVTDDDLYAIIRNMMLEDDAMLIVGGSTNRTTMEAAKLAEFFKMPLIIPFAKGDNLIAPSNKWAFRLTPTGSDMADFLMKDILTNNIFQEVTNQIFKDGIIDPFTIDVAVIFEDTDFGVSVSVDLTKKLMDNGFNVDAYSGFSKTAGPKDLDIFFEKNQNKQVKDIDIFFLIVEDKEIAGPWKEYISSIFNMSEKAIVVMLGNFFLTSEIEKKMDKYNLFVARNGLGLSTCPDYVTSNPMAMGVAAADLADKVITETLKEMPKKQWYERPFTKNDKKEELRTFRTLIQANLSSFNGDLACLGRTSFGTNGQNKGLQMELLKVGPKGSQKGVDRAILVTSLIEKIESDIKK